MYFFLHFSYVFSLLRKNYYIISIVIIYYYNYYDRQCLIASIIAPRPIPMTINTWGLTATYMRSKISIAKNIHVRMSVLISLNISNVQASYCDRDNMLTVTNVSELLLVSALALTLYIYLLCIIIMLTRYAHDIMLLGGLLQKLNLCKLTRTRSYKFFNQKNFLYDVVYITLYHKGNSFTF